MRNTPRGGVGPGYGLEKVGPGFYLDGRGAEYFYLTGMYPCVLKHLSGEPAFLTPGFIVAVLDDLRTALVETRCVELMD